MASNARNFTKPRFDFKIFEIDDINNSNFYINSSIIKPETCLTVKTNDKNIVSKIVFETIAGESKIVVDGRRRDGLH